jgi:hypothetical protein
MQALTLLGKYQSSFGDSAAQVFNDSSPILLRKKEITPFKIYIFYCKIFKRALLFLRYHITICPNMETLLLPIVIALYYYCFVHMCNCYRFVPLSLQENWQCYRFFKLSLFEYWNSYRFY